jgi:hypothetical protein
VGTDALTKLFFASYLSPPHASATHISLIAENLPATAESAVKVVAAPPAPESRAIPAISSTAPPPSLAAASITAVADVAQIPVVVGPPSVEKPVASTLPAASIPPTTQPTAPIIAPLGAPKKPKAEKKSSGSTGPTAVEKSVFGALPPTTQPAETKIAAEGMSAKTAVESTTGLPQGGKSTKEVSVVLPAQEKNKATVKEFVVDGQRVRETRVVRTETQVTIIPDDPPSKEKKSVPEVCFSMCAPRKVTSKQVSLPVKPAPPVEAAVAPEPAPAPAPAPAPVPEPVAPPAPVVKASAPAPVVIPPAPAPPPTEVAAFLAIPRPRAQFDEKRAAWLIRLPAADICMQRGVYSQYELVLQLRWFGMTTILNKPALIEKQDPSTSATEGMIAYDIPMTAVEDTRDVPGYGKCLLVRLSHQSTTPSSEFLQSGLLVLPVQIQSQANTKPLLRIAQLLTTGGTLPLIRTLPDPFKEPVPEPPKPAPATFRFPAGFHESADSFVYALVGEPAKAALITGDAFVKLLVKIHPATPGTRSVYAEIDSEQFNLSVASFPCVEFCIPKTVGKLDGHGGVVVDGLWPLELPLPAQDEALLMCLRTHCTAPGLSFAQATVSIPKEIQCACFVLSTYPAPPMLPPTTYPDDATLTLPLQSVVSIGGGCFTASLPNELFAEVAVPGECVRVVIASSYLQANDPSQSAIQVRIRAGEIKLSTAGHFVWRAAVCNVLRDRRHRIQQFTWPVSNSAGIADPWFMLNIPRTTLDRDANGDGIVNLRIPDVATPAHQVPPEGGVSNDFGYTSMEELLAAIPAEVHHRMVLLHVPRALLAEIDETLSFFLQPTSTDPSLMLLHFPVVFPTIMQQPLDCRVRAQSKCNRDDLVRVQLPSEGVLNIPGAPTIGIPFLMAAAPEEIAGDLYVDISAILDGTVLMHADPVARKAFFVPRFTEMTVSGSEPEKPRARLQIPLLLENERTRRFAFPKRLFSQTIEVQDAVLTVLFHPSMVSFHSTYGWGISLPETVVKQHGRDSVLALDIFHLEADGDVITITCPNLPAGPSPARVYFPPTVIKGVPLDCAYFVVALKRDELTRQPHESTPTQSPVMDTVSPQLRKSLGRSKSPASKVVRGFLADLFSGTSLTTEGDLTVREPAPPRPESVQMVSPSRARIWWSLDRFSAKKSLKMEDTVKSEADTSINVPPPKPPVQVSELTTSPVPPPPPPPSSRPSSMSPAGQNKLRVVSTHVYGPSSSYPMDGSSMGPMGGRRY